MKIEATKPATAGTVIGWVFLALGILVWFGSGREFRGGDEVEEAWEAGVEVVGADLAAAFRAVLALADQACEVAGPSRSLLASTAMVLGAGAGPLMAGVLAETLPVPTITVFAVEACCW